MTASLTVPPDISLLSIATGALRRRRLLIGLPLCLAIITAAVTLLSPRTFTASVAFTPSSSVGQLAGLAGVAAEFGVNLPANGDNSESPQFYADLTGSEAFLERLAGEPYLLGDSASHQTVRMDSVLGVHGGAPEARQALAAERLNRRLNATVSSATGVVRVTLRLESAPLADAVIHRVLAQIHEFNATTHQSKARWERLFIEDRLKSATDELKSSEIQLGEFMVRNRDYSRSPQLQFQADKLQRLVALRQDVLTTLARSLEQAKIDEVKAEPVLTIVEPPMVSPLPDRRRLGLKLLLALVGGLALATVVIVGSEYVRVITTGDAGGAGELAVLRQQAWGELSGWFSPVRRAWGGRRRDG